MEKRENRKWIKVLQNIGFTIFMAVMIFLILTTAQSRITGREPKLFNHRIYVVDSGSMSPTIKVDSMIIVKELKPNEINKMDIITYYGHDKNSRVTHRAIEIKNNGESFVTKGDANEVEDPMPVEGEKLIGKVVFSIPYIGKVFRFLNTQLGMVVLIILITLWIIAPLVLRRLKKPNKYVA